MAANSDGSANRRRGPGRPFPKGVSGNPQGRPKKPECITEFLNEDWVAKNGQNLGKRRKVLLDALFNTATLAGSKDRMKAIELLLAYDLGKPTERHELSGPEGGPIKSVEYDLGDGMTSGEMRKRLAELEAVRKARLGERGSKDG